MLNAPVKNVRNREFTDYTALRVENKCDLLRNILYDVMQVEEFLPNLNNVFVRHVFVLFSW